MPTYDYQCSACGHLVEIFHSIAEPPRKQCTKCGKQTFTRLISGGAGILFKGSGFYITDNKKKNSEGDATPKNIAKDSAESATGVNNGSDKKKKSADTKSSSKAETVKKPKSA